MCLRGWNHSRRLFFASDRKNAIPSDGKPGKPAGICASSIIKVMANAEETLARLAEIPNLTVSTCTPLARYTRFAIGGPADIYAETANVASFIRALDVARASDLDSMVMGGG